MANVVFIVVGTEDVFVIDVTDDVKSIFGEIRFGFVFVIVANCVVTDDVVVNTRRLGSVEHDGYLNQM